MTGHEDRCTDCDGVLRADEDVRCRWCDDNRARHPEDYELAALTWDDAPQAVAS